MSGGGLRFDEAVQAAIDGKAKPPGSLGRIESLAAQIAKVKGTLTPRMETCHHIVFAADHGIAAEGVSAYPQSVTREMVRTFLSGGAASNVFARTNDVSFAVVDAGIAAKPVRSEDLIAERIGAGTANSLNGPAMSGADLDRALETGRKLGANCGTDALSLGEMGIGNTSSAALVAAKITGIPVAELAGRGTGLDDAGLATKIGVLECASQRTASHLSGYEALREYGGFEIAMMAGAMLGATRSGRVVLVDGFIATAAAAAARTLDPSLDSALVYAHLSAEVGHARLCTAIEAEPLLSLGLRLGEGTGALLAWPLLRAAAAMLSDMASFESAGVSRN